MYRNEVDKKNKFSYHKLWYSPGMKNREDRAQQYLSSTTAPADLFNAAEDIDNYTVNQS